MNHNLQLLQNLYSSASGKYLKFKVRFDKAVQSGRFRKLHRRKQSTLISRLKKLYEKLKSLQTQLRLAGAGAGLALTLAISNPTQAQSTLGPFVRNDAANPFPAPVIVNEPRPAAVDIDNDGDLDVFVGNVDGNIQFFRNTSPAGSVTRFTEVTGSSNPLNGVNKGNHAAPAFADVDGDGDFDMLLGINNPAYNPPGGPIQYDYSPTFFFRNTGSPTNPVFTEQTGGANPFNGIYGTKYGAAMPVFVNLDGDGDVDLFIGSSYSSDLYGANPGAQYFENQGTAAAPNFVFTPHSLSYLYFGGATLAFVDVDGDDGLDAVIGTNYGGVRCFIQGIENQFTEVYGSENPFDDFNFDSNSSPVAADFDGDGDVDFLVGTSHNIYDPSLNSNLRYFENSDGEFTLVERTDLNISPFGGVDTGEEASAVFVDLDGDDDLDAVLGGKYADPGALVYINNNGAFVADPDHPISDLSFNRDNILVFVDIDNDSDQDIFLCRDYTIRFFRNSSGNFLLETSMFPSLVYGTARELSLAFVDVDSDGDFDALIGNSRNYPTTIQYFQNTGTASEPNFVLATSPAPFNTPFSEGNPNLVAIDLDNDGDRDIVISSLYGGENTHVRFFENNNNGTFTEESLPIIADGSPPFGFTSFADIDGDGDLDGFHGNGDYGLNGQITFFENTNPPPVTNVISSVLLVNGGEPTILDPILTITDPDNDDITFATVTISDYVAGEEELNFTPESGIDGNFDGETGILTFTGRASIATYRDLLRSVSINFTGTVPGGRRSNAGRVLDLAQDVTFQVRDTDFTVTTVSVVSLNIVPGSPGAELDIYNAVSPNADDDLNSFFKIENIETVSPENKVTIYNRWGDVVFEISDYNNDTRKFEGKSDSGKELPTGSYFYKIEITGQTITGYLSLKR